MPNKKTEWMDDVVVILIKWYQRATALAVPLKPSLGYNLIQDVKKRASCSTFGDIASVLLAEMILETKQAVFSFNVLTEGEPDRSQRAYSPVDPTKVMVADIDTDPYSAPTLDLPQVGLLFPNLRSKGPHYYDPPKTKMKRRSTDQEYAYRLWVDFTYSLNPLATVDTHREVLRRAREQISMTQNEFGKKATKAQQERKKELPEEIKDLKTFTSSMGAAELDNNFRGRKKVPIQAQVTETRRTPSRTTRKSKSRVTVRGTEGDQGSRTSQRRTLLKTSRKRKAKEGSVARLLED